MYPRGLQEIVQSVRTTLNEVVVTSSNLPPPLVRICQKKKKMYPREKLDRKDLQKSCPSPTIQPNKEQRKKSLARPSDAFYNYLFFISLTKVINN
jgi:hypothetical protein